jgi:ppGpp synthetase/RelA/SpoT-type nucleotidyltranferase
VADLEDVRKTWINEIPIYERFVERVVTILRSEFRNPGIEIYGRAKEIDSLLKKLILKPHKTYETLTDKAGIRVIVKFTEDVDAVGKFIEQRFADHKKDDKRATLKIDQVGYQGIHYDIKLSDSEAKGTEFVGIWAEVQVRTLAQHLWSDMSHELGYKPEVKVPDVMLRRLNRLSALVEIADDEFARLHDVIREMPEFDTYKILRLLEAQFYKFAAVEYDKELSINAIDAFSHLYGHGGLAERREQFDEFCRQKAKKLAHIFDANKGVVNRPVFLFQPEALMIFQLLDGDKFKLREEWVKHYPPRELEQLAIKWGSPYVS